MKQESNEILREKLLEDWKAATWNYKICLKMLFIHNIIKRGDAAN
jgi:hypothetical protein